MARRRCTAPMRSPVVVSFFLVHKFRGLEIGAVMGTQTWERLTRVWYIQLKRDSKPSWNNLPGSNQEPSSARRSALRKNRRSPCAKGGSYKVTEADVSAGCQDRHRHHTSVRIFLLCHFERSRGIPLCYLQGINTGFLDFAPLRSE